MRIIEWWAGLQRQYRNIFTLAIADLFILCLYLFKAPGFTALWNALTSSMPNFYDLFFLQFIALVKDMNPGLLVASGTFVTVTTTFLSLLTLHLVIGFGIGLLFQKLKQELGWSFLNYSVLILVLLVMHLFMISHYFA